MEVEIKSKLKVDCQFIDNEVEITEINLYIDGNMIVLDPSWFLPSELEAMEAEAIAQLTGLQNGP